MFNRKVIMKRAWQLYKNINHRLLTQIKATPSTAPWYESMFAKLVPFSQMLQQAWNEAKTNAAIKPVTTNPRIIAIETVLADYDMKDRYDRPDYSRMEALRAERRRLLAEVA